jgi:hypothetical protein
LFVWFLAVATAGLLVDVFAIGGSRPNLLAEPGGRAVLGVAIAVGAVLVAFALRFTLGRPIKDEGGASARDHS